MTKTEQYCIDTHGILLADFLQQKAKEGLSKAETARLLYIDRTTMTKYARKYNVLFKKAKPAGSFSLDKFKTHIR